MLPRRSQQIGNSRWRGELRDDAVRAAQPGLRPPAHAAATACQEGGSTRQVHVPRRVSYSDSRYLFCGLSTCSILRFGLLLGFLNRWGSALQSGCRAKLGSSLPRSVAAMCPGSCLSLGAAPEGCVLTKSCTAHIVVLDRGDRICEIQPHAISVPFFSPIRLHPSYCLDSRHPQRECDVLCAAQQGKWVHVGALILIRGSFHCH